MFNFLIKNKKIRLITLLSTAACVTFAGASVAHRYGGDIRLESSASFSFTMNAALAEGKIGDHHFADPAAIKAFYDARGEDSYWVGTFGLHKNVKVLLEKFENSWTHALNPERYYVSEIKLLSGSGVPAEQARLELLLSDGYIRYVDDLTGMRPAAPGLGLDPAHWVQGIKADEALSWLASNRQFSKNLKAIEPSGKVYNDFRNELIRLKKMQPEAYESVLPIAFNGILRPGQAHKTIPQIRVRMGLPAPDRAEAVYDDALAAAVMEFQRENALKADAVLGPQTVEFMNRSREDQIKQIMVNMERMRWMPKDLGERYVVVNIPSSTLWAIEDGALEFEMPVIVGRPERATKAFRSEITGMRFNPDWTIPPTIKMRDILPQIQMDVNFLYDRNIELSMLQDGRRMTLDPAAIDWATISNRELHQIDMVQIPGDNNPLGQYRVLMPNIYNIYLHDTNHPEMFENPDRAQSSGCVRMKDPAKMAAFVLDGMGEWGPEKIERYVQSQRRIDVSIERKIPVYMVYYSAWLDKEGDIVFGPDVYGEDEKLYQALLALDALPARQENASYKLVDAISDPLAQN